jgi:hypothetical protein
MTVSSFSMIKYPDEPGDNFTPEIHHNDRQWKYQKYRSDYQSREIHIPVLVFSTNSLDEMI